MQFIKTSKVDEVPLLKKTKKLSDDEKSLVATGMMMLKNKHDLSLWPKDQLLFCLKIVLKTIEACKNSDYTKFDALTTTRCCHGIALWALILLQKVRKLNLDKIYQQILKYYLEIEKNPNHQNIICTCYLSQSLIELSRLYILYLAKETDPTTKIHKTTRNKLQEIAPLSKEFFRKLVGGIQTHLSNFIAKSYYSHCFNIEDGMSINGMPLNLWGKYISPKFLRQDKNGRLYAASLYSMQIVLGFLIHSKSKVVLVNELRDNNKILKGRYIRIFQGDGQSELKLLNVKEQTDFLDNKEPVVVFGGCVHSDILNEQSLAFKMEGWIHRFSELVLAHETTYPQFPTVRDQSDFDCSTIQPEEEALKKTLEYYSQFKGFSLNDPSLCCLTHIYSASLQQVIESMSDFSNQSLPYSYLPSLPQ